jgi:spore maturation protein CgeB
MRILYVGMKYDYGDPERGLSFEHFNFYDTLIHMGHEIIYFDFMTELQQRGKGPMNRRLLDMVHVDKPDFLWCTLFSDELEIDTMRSISEATDTITFNWFCDDHWRFENYSRHWAPAFNWVSTTASSAIPKYARLGYSHVIKTQWACNHYLYKPSGGAYEHDVSFVGQLHGTRPATIAALRAAGVDVRTWGHGWPEGRVDQAEMIEIFSRSRINLNLSDSSMPHSHRRVRRLLPGVRGYARQIKGRNFEVPGCGGFLLTESAENLGDYYDAGREIGVFSGVRHLTHAVRRYLDRERERQEIRIAGYERTLREHTYARRFNDIFDRIGCGESPLTPRSSQLAGFE